MLRIAAASVLLLTLACSAGSPPDPEVPLPDTPQAPEMPQAPDTAPKTAPTPPSATLAPLPAETRLSETLDRYFELNRTRRLYIAVDKTLYRPGESIWLRVWELESSSLKSEDSGHGLTLELISPKGAAVVTKRVLATGGVAANDFELPRAADGGEYTIRVTSDLFPMGQVERPVIVSSYQPPRVKKKLEFLRRAYGPGDRVTAALRLNRATGEPLVTEDAVAIVWLDEVEIERFAVSTDPAGKAAVAFALPERIARGSGRLTVLVNDGGVTESIQRPIPITLKDVVFDLFPEGGDLVAGLPSRVYFAAKTPLGKPADVEGRVVDSLGREVATFRSLHNGMGRFSFTPQDGQTYSAVLTRPAGIETSFPLPATRDRGCVIKSLSDPPEAPALRLDVVCTHARQVVATAALRQRRLGTLSAALPALEPRRISIPLPPGAQGAVRFTLFDADLEPLAERLIYRGRGRDLEVSVTSDAASYAPRDAVTLTLHATAADGAPVEADFSLAVTDDTVLSFADDKEAHLLARIYLESEMPGQEIEEPNFYFSDDPKAEPALDLVLGTQGWRRFEWRQLLAPAPQIQSKRMPIPQPAAAHETELRALTYLPQPPAHRLRAELQDRLVDLRQRVDGRFARLAGNRPEEARAEVFFAADMEVGAEDRIGWARVRVFPLPNYKAGYKGPRTDFRDTVYWNPAVRTKADGRAEVRFFLNDSVTSFRARAEGVSDLGLLGRGETLVQSKLPVSLMVKMPQEVSAGDLIELPVSVVNETESPHEAELTAELGPAFELLGELPTRLTLAPKAKRTFFPRLRVRLPHSPADAEPGRLYFALEAAGLKDELKRTVFVTPPGFERQLSWSGTVQDRAVHRIQLPDVLPGTLVADLTLYPSPLATMVDGLDSLLRQPSGCFEQASSSNYPNIMVTQYLEKFSVSDPELLERTRGLLASGYAKLTGYESKAHGYEWFGGDPGHEALTAYGLLQFADMGEVYADVDPAMVERTRRWLRSRRDGEGGYRRNTRALDSFGAASPEVTNGYVTWALSETGERELDSELARQSWVAQETEDPYLLALATHVLLNLQAEDPATESALRRLAAMQGEDGAYRGADHSITRSGGQALAIETTSLATLALLKSPHDFLGPIRAAVDWLNRQRNGRGGYGSTQSTVLALKTLTQYAERSRRPASSGTAKLRINGGEAGSLSFEKRTQDALVLADLGPFFVPGENTLELDLDSASPLPYNVALSYRSLEPASSDLSPVGVETALTAPEVALGEGVRLRVEVENKTGEGQPMTLARVGLPGGLSFQTWQLKELRERGVIDFYETRRREVVLYFRSLAPRATKTVHLELLATVPGTYTAPASRAYLYYTDEHKDWAPPVKVRVVR